MDCYISRNWSSRSNNDTFSPLFIGAWTATHHLDGNAMTPKPPFSPLFIGAWTATHHLDGNAMTPKPPFSPLFIAAMVATQYLKQYRQALSFFQSAFHRGNGCYNQSKVKRELCFIFQSAFHRGNGCYNIIILSAKSGIAAFSPLFIAAMVATINQKSSGNFALSFSPLFIAAMVATTSLY